MSTNLVKDVFVSFYISGTVVFGLSFGCHNIQNGNLYLNNIHSIHNIKEYNKHKRLLHTTSIVKGVTYGLLWPITSSMYYLRKHKLPIVCPLYYANDYQSFYNSSNRITMPN